MHTATRMPGDISEIRHRDIDAATDATPGARALTRLRTAVKVAIASVVREAAGLRAPHLHALNANTVAARLIDCATAGSLDLRLLDVTRAPTVRPRSGFEDPSTASSLILARLPASAWRDMQLACGQVFSEVILPAIMGIDARLPGLRGLRSLRSISFGVNRGSNTADLLGLADLGRPLHVTLRCSHRPSLKVTAPQGVTVSAEAYDSPMPGAYGLVAEKPRGALPPAGFIEAAQTAHYRLVWQGEGPGTPRGGWRRQREFSSGLSRMLRRRWRTLRPWGTDRQAASPHQRVPFAGFATRHSSDWKMPSSQAPMSRPIPSCATRSACAPSRRWTAFTPARST